MIVVVVVFVVGVELALCVIVVFKVVVVFVRFISAGLVAAVMFDVVVALVLLRIAIN